MRRRATTMTVSAVTVAVLLLGLPGIVLGSFFLWRDAVDGVHRSAVTIMNAVDRRTTAAQPVQRDVVDNAVSSSSYAAYVFLRTEEGAIEAGRMPAGETISHTATGVSGARVTVAISRSDVVARIGYLAGLGTVAILVSFGVGVVVARWQSRRLSAPLIYLAAAAEQIGAGQARPRMKKSGIEEIDLVSEELARTGERMAGRLAAERQFAADASHQLRTPLTALSMRIEEIELVSSQEEVRAEARTCLEQVERMTRVVTDLLDANARSNGQTEAIHILEVFNTAREEWEDRFESEGRPLVFLDEAEMPVLAEAGKLGQVLATLIENSLRYGAGTTTVRARKGTSKRGIVIEVSDEGEGVPDEIAPNVFEKGVSGHGSTGIGLALARDLAQAMGGRLELAQNQPPVFTVSLAAIPKSLDPDRVMPEGALMSMGRRSRRF